MLHSLFAARSARMALIMAFAIYAAAGAARPMIFCCHDRSPNNVSAEPRPDDTFRERSEQRLANRPELISESMHCGFDFRVYQLFNRACVVLVRSD